MTQNSDMPIITWEEPIRLQKFLARQWVCSRRQADRYIADGKVYVNDVVAELGQKVTSADVIRLANQVIEETSSYVYYVFHKPRWVVTTCKSHNDTTAVLDLIETKERVFPIGRLDKDTTWLLIMTNDGRIAHRLMHPSFLHEKEYVVEVFWPITDEELEILWKGSIRLDGMNVQPCKVTRLSSGTFSIVLTEGKNRQIRRMVETLDKRVKKLKRIRIENIELRKQEVGELRPLKPHEKEALLSILDL